MRATAPPCAETSRPARAAVRGRRAARAAPRGAGAALGAGRRAALRLPLALLAAGGSVAAPHDVTRGNGAALAAEGGASAETAAALRGAFLAEVGEARGKWPGQLRLLFHDAGTYAAADKEAPGGPNGSVRFELDRPESKGLKPPVRLAEKARVRAEKALGREVSFADAVVAGAAAAVEATGGPRIDVRCGRLDVAVADPPNRMPPETLDAAQLKAHFASRGYSVRELVALSGAHTLGAKGFGDPTTFSGEYFQYLLRKPWESDPEMGSMIGLPTDRALVSDEETLAEVRRYAADEHAFFGDFAAALTRLADEGAVFAS